MVADFLDALGIIVVFLKALLHLNGVENLKEEIYVKVKWKKALDRAKEVHVIECERDEQII